MNYILRLKINIKLPPNIPPNKDLLPPFLLAYFAYNKSCCVDCKRIFSCKKRGFIVVDAFFLKSQKFHLPPLQGRCHRFESCVAQMAGLQGIASRFFCARKVPIFKVLGRVIFLCAFFCVALQAPILAPRDAPI